jgi:hypothetical protein
LSEDSRRETIISWLAFEDIFFLLTTPRFVVNDDDVTAIFLPYYIIVRLRAAAMMRTLLNLRLILYEDAMPNAECRSLR